MLHLFAIFSVGMQTILLLLNLYYDGSRIHLYLFTI